MASQDQISVGDCFQLTLLLKRTQLQLYKTLTEEKRGLLRKLPDVHPFAIPLKKIAVMDGNVLLQVH